MKILERLISFLKDEPYRFEDDLNFSEIIVVLFTKLLQIIRGLKYKMLALGNIKVLIFVGKRVEVNHLHLFKSGKNLTLENGYI